MFDVLVARPVERERRTTEAGLSNAVHRNPTLSRAGLRERLFTAAFSDLVYPQIWEDPVVDMAALAIKPHDHVLAIASGGCNILSYLTANPARVTALDLNHAHIALTRLKLVAARHLPSYRDFADFFVLADRPGNIALYDTWLADHLDAVSRRYWDQRDVFGRRRIAAFARGFYHGGLLGRFIGATHLLARALGLDVRKLVQAGSLAEQREIFESDFAPVLKHPLLRRLLGNPASLYGLGIPPAQFAALSRDGGVADTIFERVERLACAFPIQENYFAWQAFARRYGPDAGPALPPYLQEESFADLRRGVDKVQTCQLSVTEFLGRSANRSLDCFVLLDAQDWMNDFELESLWRQIDRTAARGARVIFRTAAKPDLLPGRVPQEILGRWRYHSAASEQFHARDRSSIYGGFHLYTRRDMS